jgi:hypothetical protein
MLTRDVDAFLAIARGCAPDFGPATARAAFLVAPDGFGLAEESARDNRYMAAADAFDAGRASAQHRALQRAVFPNNVFATAPGRSIIGRMRHPVRQREAERGDIRRFFTDTLGRTEIDLSSQPHPCELTGALAIDRARGLGFCGLSERCDDTGARLMHDAFGLRATLLFDLAPGEYHTNVVLAVLAGKAALVCLDGFADGGPMTALQALYGPHVIPLGPDERATFAGNAIALRDDSVWMSATAEAALTPATRGALDAAGFRVRSVALDAIEAAGGSLRCCVGEVF